MTETIGALAGAFVAWIGSAIPSAHVGWDAAADGKAGIGLRMLRVEPCPAERRGGQRSAVEATILLQARAADPLDAATLAGELAFACADGHWTDDAGTVHRLDVVRGEEASLALGPAGLPDLAMIVRLPFARERVGGVARPVLRRMTLETGFVGEIEGVVLGQRGEGPAVPIAGAAVSAPGLGRSTLTAAGGVFRLTGLPPGGDIPLEIVAKGRTMALSVRQRQGVVVQMQLAADA